MIDATAPTQPFPHVWEQIFGSGRAILSLRESYRDDLKHVKNITGLEFIRFHGFFDDEVGVYDRDPAMSTRSTMAFSPMVSGHS